MKTIYLDYWALRKIGDSIELQSKISSFINRENYKVAFSFLHLAESACQECAQSKYKWINYFSSLPYIWIEVESGKVQKKEASIITTRYFLPSTNDVFTPFSEEVGAGVNYKFKNILEIIIDEKNRIQLEKKLKGYKANIDHGFEILINDMKWAKSNLTTKERKSITQNKRNAALKKIFRAAKVESTISFNISNAEIEKIISGINPADLPTWFLEFEIFDTYRVIGQYEPNDSVDYIHSLVPAIYCDYLVIDKKWKEVLRQTKSPFIKAAVFNNDDFFGNFLTEY